jgi:hypothetical protein
MVDGMNIISPKIKSFDKNVSDDDPFWNLLTKSEKEYFWDSKLEDRICARCGQDHSVKPNFNGVKTSIERIPELIPLSFKED